MRWTNLPEFGACPPDWEVSPLSTKADFIAGQSPDSAHYNARGEGVPFLQGNAEFGPTYPSPTVYCTQPTKLCEVGDTLISVRAPVGALNRADRVYGLGRGLGAVHATSVEADYLYHAMTRWHLPLRRAAQGSTFDAITARHFKQLRCCLPTNSDERVAIVERLNLASEALEATEATLRVAWRLKTALMQQLFTYGVPGRHTRFKQTKIGEIPESWDIGRISKIVKGEITNGISPQSRPEPPGTPILNVSCVAAGRCDPKKVTYVDLEFPPTNVLLAKQGDFFVLRGNGNRDFVATGGLLSEQPPDGAVFSDLLIRIPFDPEKTVPGFMPLLWQAQSFLRPLQSNAVSGSGLWKIGLREIRRLEFVQPPKDEQAEIVEILSSADESIRACETEVIALDRLKRSLLENLLTGRVRLKI